MFFSQYLTSGCLLVFASLA